MALSGLALIGASPLGQLDLSVDGFRSERGLLQVCLTRDARHFPDCEHDPAARKITAAVGQPVSFPELPSGNYAVALFHDENGNGRLDTLAGIPREGVGFSRNPRLMFGPPAFTAAEFSVAGETGQSVKLKYLL